MKRVVVLVSGSGTLLQALLDADAAGTLDGVVVGVVSDRLDAYGLVRAREAGVATAVVPLGRGDDRAAWDAELARVIAGFEPDLVVGAGFMRLLGAAVLSRFPGRIVNSHPALLPAFPGAHGVRDALAYGVRVTGASVFVVDEGVDTGRILAQEPVRVLPDDTEDSLHERIKAVERPLLVGVVRDWPDGCRAPASSPEQTEAGSCDDRPLNRLDRTRERSGAARINRGIAQDDVTLSER